MDIIISQEDNQISSETIIPDFPDVENEQTTVEQL